jgi:Rha family phage regulatory protein
MTELMVTEKEFKMTSLDLANITGKLHKNVIRDIKDEIENLEKSGINELIFELVEYKDEKGEKRPCYKFGKRGAMQIGARYSAEIRYKLINYVETLENALRDKLKSEWLESRSKGKMIRKQTTDAIEDYLIPHAIQQGSKNSGMLFMTYSKLVNSICEIEANQRDNIRDNVLMYISFIEDFIQKTIIEEVENGTYYKDIYKICKTKCETLKTINPPSKEKYLFPIVAKLK